MNRPESNKLRQGLGFSICGLVPSFSKVRPWAVDELLLLLLLMMMMMMMIMRMRLT